MRMSGIALDPSRRRQCRLRATAEWLLTEASDSAQALVRGAEGALAGRLILPGTGGTPHFVGDPPRWQHSPFGNEQFVFVLNRLEHWQTLLRAWQLTGDDRFPAKVVAELDDWLVQCPRPSLDDRRAMLSPRRNPGAWGPHNVGVRASGALRELVGHLVDSRWLDDGRLDRLRASLREHGEYLAYVGRHLHADVKDNHAVMENLGLLAVAVTFPDLAEADAWRTQAADALVRSARRQLTPDGAQVEGCPGYHGVCLRNYACGLMLLREVGHTFPDDMLDAMQRAAAYSLHACRPSGDGVPQGDSCADGAGMVGAFYQAAATGEVDILRTFHAMAGDASLRKLVLDHAWTLPAPARLLQEAVVAPGRRLPTTTRQRGVKAAAVRTDWSTDAFSFYFNCMSPVFNGHAHQDPLGFDFCALGRALLVDPGRYTYAESEERRLFKSAAWHNCLTLNHREPFDYCATWWFSPQATGELDWVQQDDRVLAAQGWHGNYAPVRHRRCVAIVDRCCLLVLDELIGGNWRDAVQVRFHVPTEHVEHPDAAGGEVVARIGDVRLALVSSGEPLVVCESSFLSPRMDQLVASTRVRFNHLGPAEGPRCYATLIVPTRYSEPATVEPPSVVAGNDVWRGKLTVQGVPLRFTWQTDALLLDTNTDPEPGD